MLPPSSLATVSSPPASSSGVPGVNHGATNVEVVQVEDLGNNNNKGQHKKDEVAIVVGSRKNSMTKAVRYVQREIQFRDESRDNPDPEIPGFGQIFQSRNPWIEVSRSQDHEII